MKTTQLIQFDPEVTPEALAILQEQAKTFPVKIENEKQYKEIYDNHQKVKKIRFAVDKKKDELIKTEKKHFESNKLKILEEQRIIMLVLTPIETQLLETRTEWEEEKERIKQEKAEVEAEKQRLEFERQQLIRDEIEAWKMNEEFDRLKKEDEARRVEDARLKKEKEKSEVEKQQLEKAKIAFEQEKAEFEAKKLKEISEVEKPTKEAKTELDNPDIKPEHQVDGFMLSSANQEDVLSKETIQSHEEDDPTFIENAENELANANATHDSPKRERATELEYLTWFMQEIDFGPSHSNVMDSLNQKFIKQTGKNIPDGWNFLSDGETSTDID